MQQKTILSGIRVSGKLHLGNYLGALKQFVDIQNSGQYECFFFLADLHGLTTPFEPKEFRAQTLEIAAEYIAAGIDPKKSTFFLQSQVAAHAELAWVFNCITPLGELERMTQYKDKAKQHAENINAGLLTYPALMAADILLYKPVMVPVGEDQQQHIELARVVARKFNSRFGKTFPEPKNYNLKPLRLMSLSDPKKKMSKSEPKGCVFLDDEPDVIMNKFKKAVTATSGNDSGGGVDNLFFLLETFGETGVIRQFKNQQKDGSLKFSDVKEYVANQISSHLAPFREKKKAVLKDTEGLAKILGQGAKKAEDIASKTMFEVKQKIGLL
jgi:tryptophanyl-tRNA synthetase